MLQTEIFTFFSFTSCLSSADCIVVVQKIICSCLSLVSGTPVLYVHPAKFVSVEMSVFLVRHEDTLPWFQRRFIEGARSEANRLW